MSDLASWMADIHAECFTTPRPWSAREFAEMIADPTIFTLPAADGFLMARTVLDEAELMTICVRPSLQRSGVGHALLGKFLTTLQDAGVEQCFLEVAENNSAAIGLYQKFGFTESGRRRRYYAPPDGPKIDAILFSKRLVTT